MSETFVNKVAESGIITLNLEDYLPNEPLVVFDMKDYLFMGLILKEKDFRAALKNLDLTIYQNKHVAVTCSADAIVPVWAYMLATSALQPVAREVYFGDENTVTRKILAEQIAAIPIENYTDKRIVLKGCGEKPIPEEAYVQMTQRLRPVAKSIMYGEPCSTVPVYKKEKPI
jgi:hypothetical protein